MICPKCGFEQPDGVECMRCGVIISRYKGPVAGAGDAAGPRDTPPALAPGGASPPPSFIPPPPVIAGGTVHAPVPPPPSLVGSGFGEPLPAGAGGSVYGGPPPAAGGGGTVYGGPGSIAPAFSSFPANGQTTFLGTFELGKILSEAFSIFFSNFIPFVLLSALISLPVFSFAAYLLKTQKSPASALSFFFLALLLQILLGQLTTAGVTYGVYQQIRGQNPSLMDCLRVAFSRFFPVLGVGIVAGFAVGLGAVFCLVPGFILAAMFAVAIPVTVEERAGVSDALRRSAFLTDGFRWQVFGLLFLLGVLEQILVRVAISPAHDLGTLLMISSAVNVLTIGLRATAVAVMYYRLRSVKESVDVDQISSVFA
ncbi:MAG TPA: hypothetical protein VIA62_18295 [Thermoanaerobaculia bacterium]|jgi:hypothetical protein|nr:hypothetical protein [Thermoanaerobaculia bacterium]